MTFASSNSVALNIRIIALRPEVTRSASAPCPVVRVLCRTALNDMITPVKNVNTHRFLPEIKMPVKHFFTKL
jgi:hypothetical protein